MLTKIVSGWFAEARGRPHTAFFAALWSARSQLQLARELLEQLEETRARGAERLKIITLACGSFDIYCDEIVDACFLSIANMLDQGRIAAPYMR
jgi:hypothetical protein